MQVTAYWVGKRWFERCKVMSNSHKHWTIYEKVCVKISILYVFHNNVTTLKSIQDLQDYKNILMFCVVIIA